MFPSKLSLEFNAINTETSKNQDESSEEKTLNPISVTILQIRAKLRSYFYGGENAIGLIEKRQ